MGIIGIISILILSPFLFLRSFLSTPPVIETRPPYIEGKPCSVNMLECPVTSPIAPQGNSFQTVLKTQNYNHPNGNSVIKSDEDYRKVFAISTNDEKIVKPEFQNEMLIAAFMGDRSSGGYSIEITSIKEESEKISVYVTQTSPGPNCMNITVLTSPAHIVKYKSSNKPVTFITKKSINDCK